LQCVDGALRCTRPEINCLPMVNSLPLLKGAILGS
jgi:hypothetical protein